jgi:surface carbohydrate biosynthesis protein
MNNVYYSQESYFGQADRPIIKFLADYAHKNNKQLMIIPRNHQNALNRDAEEVYFRKLVGGDVDFLEPSGPYGSYQALDVAGIIVGVDSTLVYEAIARGAKGAVFAIRSELLGIKGFSYGWPSEYTDDGPFWTNCLNIETFERIIDHLFEISDEHWQNELLEHHFDKVMFYDPQNKILQSTLTKELGPPIDTKN